MLVSNYTAGKTGENMAGTSFEKISAKLKKLLN
jgi:hypothetical protein